MSVSLCNVCCVFSYYDVWVPLFPATAVQRLPMGIIAFLIMPLVICVCHLSMYPFACRRIKTGPGSIKSWNGFGLA
jgi:hypothetical protein